MPNRYQVVDAAKGAAVIVRQSDLDPPYSVKQVKRIAETVLASVVRREEYIEKAYYSAAPER